MILLDTHAIVWTAHEPERIGAQTRELVAANQLNGQVAVSAITFWEIALLNTKRRMSLTASADALRRDFIDSGGIELPLTGDIAIRAVALEDLHGDPADRFIAATAIVHGATLVTADRRLLEWRHTLPRQNALT